METRNDRIEKFEIVNNNSSISWRIADKWFRILEFSFILALLHYFAETLNNIPLKIIYWLSWMVFWSWFDDVSKIIVEFFHIKKRFSENKKFWVWVLSATFVMIIYSLVNFSADLMIAREYLK